MVAENFDANLKCVRVHEGGYSDDKDGRGGDHTPVAASQPEFQLDGRFAFSRSVAHVNHHVRCNA